MTAARSSSTRRSSTFRRPSSSTFWAMNLKNSMCLSIDLPNLDRLSWTRTLRLLRRRECRQASIRTWAVLKWLCWTRCLLLTERICPSVIRRVRYLRRCFTRINSLLRGCRKEMSIAIARFGRILHIAICMLLGFCSMRIWIQSKKPSSQRSKTSKPTNTVLESVMTQTKKWQLTQKTCLMSSPKSKCNKMMEIRSWKRPRRSLELWTLLTSNLT